MCDTLLAISAVFSDDIVLNFNEKNLKKKIQKKQKTPFTVGLDKTVGRSDEDKQTIFLGGGLSNS